MDTPTEIHSDLLNHARELRVGGRDSFLLNDRNAAYFVATGAVDLFLVRVANNQPTGTRSFVSRIGDGQLILGVGSHSGSAEWGLLAVPVPGTVLKSLTTAQIRALHEEERNREKVTLWVEQWMNALLSGSSREPPTEEPQSLAPGAEIHFKESRWICSPQGTTWITHQCGRSHIFGDDDCGVDGKAAFPLTKHSWLRVSKGTKIICLDTVDLHQGGAIWDSVEHFHSMVPLLLHRTHERAASAENERLRRKVEIRQKLFHDALTQVAEILRPDSSRSRRTDSLGADSLFTACSIVGNELGITFKEHPDSRSGRAISDPLTGILAASRIRHRTVALNGSWWEEDNGPLLAFVKETGDPVALIPDSNHRYTLINPESNESFAVDKAVSSTLAPSAVAFYRPFPEKQLNGFDLLSHGLFRCSRDLLAILAVGTLGAQVAIIVPYLTGHLFDVVIPGSRLSELFQIVAALTIASFVTVMFNVTRSIATLRIETKMGVSIQAAVWDRLLQLPAPFFRKYSAGNLASRANSIEDIRAILSGVVVSSILGGMFSVSYFAMLFFYNMKLAMWATGLVATAVVVAVVASLYQLKYQRLVQNVRVRLSGKVLQFVNGVAKLRVTGTEGVAFSLWAKEFITQRRHQFAAKNLDNIQATFFEVFPIISSAVIFYQVSRLTEAAALSTGAFLAFNAAFVAFITAALKMTEAVSSLLMALPLYESAQPILTAIPEVKEAKSYPGKLKGEIELSHIAFRYSPDSPLILRDISLRISPGEFVAFVGPSGSGKSTIFRLLLGFESPESGTIYLDGQDLAGLDITAVRQQIGVVLQNGKLLPGDIFMNIIGSSTTLTLDDAWEAARLAGFAEDIESMPMGMHTVVSEGGGTLSGGQRQRLMIARAIVRKPNMLFMDEATSALDNRTQEIVSKSLHNLHATRIVIAHRLSTIVHADKICFIEGGYVREQGTYDELMSLKGKFYELAKRQIV